LPYLALRKELTIMSKLAAGDPRIARLKDEFIDKYWSIKNESENISEESKET